MVFKMMKHELLGSFKGEVRRRIWGTWENVGMGDWTKTRQDGEVVIIDQAASMPGKGVPNMCI